MSRPDSAAAQRLPACARLDVEYVVPLRWSSDAELADFTGYLQQISSVVHVTVVDGSDPVRFAAHAAVWAPFARHVAPRPWPGRNGKVAGVVTGVRAARAEKVVVADDDVRYTADQLREVTDRLTDGVDVVRPQNVLVSGSWHAAWDTARTLLNRAFGTDYPGTFAVRRSTFLRMGGYDGDVLFENLQMLKTFAAAGGVEHRAPELYIARQAPQTAQFLDQRVRQAYDDFAQPVRLVLELSWLPLLGALALRRPRLLGAAAAVPVAVAELGRRRHGGASRFSPSAALWAPLWVLERSGCIWLALAARLRGGVRYRGTRLSAAATAVTQRPPLDLLDLDDVRPSAAEFERAS